MPEKLTLVLADDHGIVRSGLRRLLEQAGTMEVVAVAADADEAARKVLGYKPAVLVLDLNMPGTPSLELVDQMRAASPQTKIIVLTMQSGPEFAREALQAGVDGYVLKESASVELGLAIETAMAGGTYLSPSLGARLAATPARPAGYPDSITPREGDVLKLLVLGFTNVEIGDELNLSRRTIETHRSSVQQKTGCPTRADLVRYAARNGLIDLEQFGS